MPIFQEFEVLYFLVMSLFFFLGISVEVVGVVGHELEDVEDALGVYEDGDVLLDFVLGLLPIGLVDEPHLVVLVEVTVEFAPVVIPMVFFVVV